MRIGADLINHIEAATHGDRLIQQIRSLNKQVGITINPITPVSAIEHYLPLVDMILVMSVNPGFSGQKCISYAFDKIVTLDNIRKKNNYNYTIQVDGGIHQGNVQEVLNKGADIIVAGSGFFGLSQEERQKFAHTIHSHNK